MRAVSAHNNGNRGKDCKPVLQSVHEEPQLAHKQVKARECYKVRTYG